jgi:hypothetical protein
VAWDRSEVAFKACDSFGWSMLASRGLCIDLPSA